MTMILKTFEFAKDVETKEDMALYLSTFLEEGGTEALLEGLNHLIKSKGMTETSRLSGLNRQNLYRLLNGETQPKFETLNKLLHALGFKLSIEAA